MNPLLELDGCVEDYGMADVVRTLIEREMRIADAGSLQRGDDAVEFRDVGYRADAYPVHPAARDPVVAHGHVTWSDAQRGAVEVLDGFWDGVVSDEELRSVPIAETLQDDGSAQEV